MHIGLFRLFGMLVLAMWGSQQLDAQITDQSIERQLVEKLEVGQFTGRDTFRTTIEVYNSSAFDSLYQIQTSSAQINRAIINKTDTLFAGRFVGDHLLQEEQHDYYWPITFKANSWTHIDILSYNLSDHDFETRIKVVRADQLPSFLDRWMVDYSRGAFLNIFFLGSVLALLLYFGMLSFLSPRKDFMIYAVYLAFVFMHYMLSTDTSMRLGIFFPNDPINNVLINEFTLNMMYAVYIYFAYSFLEVAKHDLWVKRYLFFELGFHVFLAILFTTYLISTKHIIFTKTHLYDLYFLAFILSIISVILIYLRIPGRIKYFVIVGSLLLSIASLLEVLNDTYIYRWFEFNEGTHRFLSLNVTQVGIFLELICFSLGIGYKHNQAFQEKEAAQNSYIGQLKKNQELKDKYTDQLQQEVEVQAKELIAEREVSLKTQYDNRIMQLESDMLLSQMNPHFIFNSLNSIKYFALTKTLEETADYITDFSKLMRMILQDSRKKKITIENEINFLNLYLRIESRRHDKLFTHSVVADESVDLFNDVIPAMLIQPIVENAIVHGLLQKQEPGMVNVKFMKTGDVISVHILDDGIGRLAAAKLKKQKEYSQQSSLATAITIERIQLYNDLNNSNASLKVTDLVDVNGVATGTQVHVTIPQHNS